MRDVPPHVDLARRARFERLFAHAYEPLQRYVRRRADAAVVDDVVAETLLVVWRRLDDVPADAELSWRRRSPGHGHDAGRPVVHG
jgi:RNA polymerase sigma-70 factor (ECF subfamily)